MIALFDEPPRVILRPDRYPIETDQAVGLLMGLAFEPTDPARKPSSRTLWGVVCLADGSVVLLPQGAWVLAYRYEVENDRFVDTTIPKEERDT